ncbi:TetR/AcrR family transcriptional regulator [Streptomyces litchfieldiae]|uniref:TetR family transcriptional regulator n=1 Tax=Streptomyces litchfieldiae TaxID=3075543 RepID=A0ABU2MS37_9ACTN|nr:TetR family transcriptional regulator [Streptomyces sp. DSM 44938]MDT0344335.1 TetR family transcriptional regulator [Streptomyces sp. DSM 44938]
MGADTTPSGSRELKKRRTHDELLRAGLDLFLTRGYEKTTVGDIAQRAEVSERTFFRYFANKEELVLRPLRDASHALLAEVKGRPPEEEPLEALRAGGMAAMRRVMAPTPELYLNTLRVIGSEPEARAAVLRFGAEEQRDLAAVLAARESTEPGDLRPVLLAAAFTAAAIQTTLSWEEGADGTMASLEAMSEAHLTTLHEAVAVSWRREKPRQD